MRKLFTQFLLIFFLAANIHAQTTFGDSLSVKAQATVNASTPSITLIWPGDTDANEFFIYRKNKGALSWGAALATLPSTSTNYTDLTVSVNTLYEYKIMMSSLSTPTKIGYLSTGIEVKANSNRGIAIVVIESSYVANIPFQNALDLFLDDLELDGWYPKTIYVNSTDLVTDVKANIVTTYNTDPTKTKLLVLVGNVPVPHSGDMNPDGHPDHQGAWPTDSYYAEVNGNWTDVSVNNVISANPLNHNTPGDGNFDQTYLPSDVELQVGRIDLSNMPSFASSEEELLLAYFDKDHRYKTADILIGEQALIDDNFTTYDEGFSQNGYNNFAALVGESNTYLYDYFGQLSYTTSTTGSYLWSYGCGGGTYTSASGIGSTANFNTDSLSSIFTMLFGSYFGDWDYSDAFLRAPLAQGNTLTNCWAGRPNWYFNHMAMGENIGYSTRLTQNNSTLYTPSVYGGLARMISVGLMGDPSLRMFYISQPTNLTVTENGNSNNLSWSAGGTEIGYNVYRRYADSVDFVKLTSSLITATTFTDNTLPVDGTVYYYVKAVELKTSASGSYENESLAAKIVALSTVGIETNHEPEIKLFPNPSLNNIQFQVDELLLGNPFIIVDLEGKIILSGIISSTQQLTDISILEAGIYTLKIAETEIKFVKL